MFKSALITGATLSACLIVSNAMAVTQFTTINPPPSGEKNHAYMLGKAYGGTFTKSGVDYTSNDLIAKRLSDTSSLAPTYLSGDTRGGDSTWPGPQTYSFVVKAKYAADNSVFGYMDGTSGGTFHELINTSNFNNEQVVNITGAFRWALKDKTTGKLWTSDPDDNKEGGKVGYDHLATYAMLDCKDTGKVCEWALFWEDRGNKDCADFDYNDAMICISSCNIPAPTAGVMLMGAMGGTMVRRKRKA